MRTPRYLTLPIRSRYPISSHRQPCIGTEDGFRQRKLVRQLRRDRPRSASAAARARRICRRRLLPALRSTPSSPPRRGCPTATARFRTSASRARRHRGSDNGVFSGTPVTIAPGPLTITLSEGVAHRGAGWRISLSGDGDDSTRRPSTRSHPARRDVAPDVQAGGDLPPASHHDRDSGRELRALFVAHMSNPMTDKIGGDGSPSGIGCTEPGSCFSVYYSCTQPLLRITGATPARPVQLPGWFPSHWPTLLDGRRRRAGRRHHGWHVPPRVCALGGWLAARRATALPPARWDVYGRRAS